MLEGIVGEISWLVLPVEAVVAVVMVAFLLQEVCGASCCAKTRHWREMRACVRPYELVASRNESKHQLADLTKRRRVRKSKIYASNLYIVD